MLFIERSSWRKLRAVSGRKINKQWNNSKDFRSISVFCVLGLFMCLCSMCDCGCGCGCGMWLFASITPRKFKCHEAKLRDWFWLVLQQSRVHNHSMYCHKLLLLQRLMVVDLLSMSNIRLFTAQTKTVHYHHHHMRIIFMLWLAC